jgi:hypothetical protein
MRADLASCRHSRLTGKEIPDVIGNGADDTGMTLL